jgi:hypothetical protein
MHRVFTKSIVRYQKTAGGISIPPAVFIILSFALRHSRQYGRFAEVVVIFGQSLPLCTHQKFARASNLLHNMRYQAQIAFDENVSGFQIPLTASFQIVLLFLRCQGFREASGGELQ